MKIKERISGFLRKPGRTNQIFFLLIAILFLFLISIAVAPLHWKNDIEKQVKSDSLFVAGYDSIRNHPDLSDLVRNRTHKEALLALSTSDSIQLEINLSDSLVSLWLQGVKIHATHIGKFEQDRLLGGISNMQYVKIFSEPLAIEKQFATIVKEPVVVRHAPRDAEEAALTAWEPDTLLQNPAYLWLALETGINIVFEQELGDDLHSRIVRFFFYVKIKITKLATGAGRFFSFKKQEYYPTIRIWLPTDDLRAIYRALPHSGRVVVRYS